MDSHADQKTDAKTSRLDGVDDLLPLVYEELRRLARMKLSDQAPGHTLQATALVHEAYLKLSSDPARRWKSRRHFLAYASEAMRRILIDSARRKLTAKRGGGEKAVELVESRIASAHPAAELLEVNEALERLARIDPEAAELTKLRYFVGLTMAEAAEAMDLNLRAAERLWTFARASLKYEIDQVSDEV